MATEVSTLKLWPSGLKKVPVLFAVTAVTVQWLLQENRDEACFLSILRLTFFHICGPKSGSVLLIFITCRILFCFLFGKYAFSYAGHVRPLVPPSSQQRWHSYFCWHFRLKLINIFIGGIINILWAGFPHPSNLLWLHFILEHISGQC